MRFDAPIEKSLPVDNRTPFDGLKPSLVSVSYSIKSDNLIPLINIKKNTLARLHLLLFCLLTILTQSNAHTPIDTLSKKLTSYGFENVRVKITKNHIYVGLENNQYRWDVKGLVAALDLITHNTKERSLVTLILLKEGIPQISLSVPKGDWEKFREGTLPATQMAKTLDISYQTTKAWSQLKKANPVTPYDYQAEVVIYPQLTIQNTKLKELYEFQFNLAPALELSLWKGMKLTGQMIVPLINELEEEEDHFRPGFLTLSQCFRLPRQWFGRITTGNFNEHRYGADLFLEHPFKNNRWTIALNAGITGKSHFYDGQWTTSKLNTITWLAKAQYFYPSYNLQFDLSYGKYLNNDYGVRADCTRHFGETAIGFYATYTDGESTGGFHLSIPLPPRKQKSRRSFRFRPAYYFDWTYNAKTDFNHGRYYETRPNENRSEHWLNPLFIKDQLLKTK